MFIWRKFYKSIRDALRGIKEAFVENSFRILFVVALIVTTTLFVFPFSSVERAVLLLVTVLVLSLELINSQIERVLDILRPDYNEEVRKIKDISAGAVLLASIGAVAVGLVVTIPYILEKFSLF